MPHISRLGLKAVISVSFLILPSAVFAQAQIHHWVDLNGIHHYSDTPPKNQNLSVKQKDTSAHLSASQQVNYARESPTQVEVPLASLLNAEEKEDFVRRGISLEQKILVLFDDTY